MRSILHPRCTDEDLQQRLVELGEPVIVWSFTALQGPQRTTTDLSIPAF
ncbi:hypothetical protein ACH49M_32935 [Rhodococcus qingshengii]